VCQIEKVLGAWHAVQIFWRAVQIFLMRTTKFLHIVSAVLLTFEAQ
jgi:hypothetical protein